jgi:hypothetical protein
MHLFSENFLVFNKATTRMLTLTASAIFKKKTDVVGAVYVCIPSNSKICLKDMRR